MKEKHGKKDDERMEGQVQSACRSTGRLKKQKSKIYEGQPQEIVDRGKR